MQLLRVIRLAPAPRRARQRLRAGNDERFLRAQRLLYGLMRSGRDRRIVVHHRRLDLAAQRQRHRRGRVRVQLPHRDAAFTHAAQHLLQGLDVQDVLHALAKRLLHQRMVFPPHRQ